MSENMHTPGPWVVKGNAAAIQCRIRPKRGGGDVAYAVEVFMDRKAREANARLIAAAPDLLEALTALVANTEADILHRYPDDVSGARYFTEQAAFDAEMAGLDKARAAIARATGQESAA